MGAYMDALSAGHTVNVTARFGGIVMTDKALGGKILLRHDVKPEPFTIEWDGTDSFLTDDHIKDHVVGQRISAQGREDLNEALGVVIRDPNPEWYDAFVLARTPQELLKEGDKEDVVYDFTAMKNYFRRASELSQPKRFVHRFEMGCPVHELAPQLPLVNLSCALVRFGDHLDPAVSGNLEIQTAEIYVEPAFDRKDERSPIFIM